MSFLVFNLITKDTKKVTSDWQVCNASTGYQLGVVGWYTGWRRYVYHPSCPQMLDAGCMREIANFAEAETNKRKEQAK